MRLVDADGDDVLVGDAGRDLGAGTERVPGLLERRRGHRAALDDDGWLHTGDIAVVDDDGYLFLVDRAKDLIIVSGFNVYPAEVEEVLARAPRHRRRARWSASPTRTPGEAVKAFVVAGPGARSRRTTSSTVCAQHLARYKCPEKVIFVDELPHGLAGKVLRASLKEAAAG